MADFIKSALNMMPSPREFAETSFRTTTETASAALSLAEIDALASTNGVGPAKSGFEKTEATVQDMLFTMRLVSFICNFWTIFLSLIVIYRLADSIVKAKKKRELKRKKLYFSSILFVSLILV